MDNYSAHSPIILAHRGGHKELPDNSFEAFQAAIKAGCSYLETDVMLGEDGKVYLYHGSSKTKRLNADITAKLTTLETLFNTFPNCFFAVDPKHETVVEPLAQLIVRFNMQRKVCVGSSVDSRARRVADAVERQSGIRPVTALVSGFAWLRLILVSLHFTYRMKSGGAEYIYVHRSIVSKSLIQAAHRSNLKLIAWTVNDPATMRKLLSQGADGLMTDTIDTALRL